MDEKVKELIKKVQIIHLAICAGVVAIYVVAGQFTIEQLKGQEIDANDLVYIAIPIAAFFLSNLVFKFQLGKLDPGSSIQEKFPAFITASMIRWAILEVGAIIILFLAPDMVILGILLTIYLLSIRPTEQKIRGVLQPHGQ